MNSTNNNTYQKKPYKRKLTLLVILVGFVFIILLLSMVAAVGFLYLLNRFGWLQPVTVSRLPIFFAFLLVISLFTAIILTAIAGNYTLRPIKKFVEATKEIAAGNFSVRVETRGPDEFNRLATSFNEMARELGSIETLRDDFISDISHEYKTPIVSIRGFAKLVKKGNLTKEQQDEYLDIIISESTRLSELSSNVMLLSKLNTLDKPTDNEEFSLDEQLRRVIVLMNQQMEKKHIEADIELEACTIIANQELLQQVWINLLSNAIKFTAEGGRIGVQLTGNPVKANVAIRDNGIGMNQEVVKHVFDKFYQRDNSRASEGYGLGLSLVKSIVSLHNGSIDVESVPGEGSIFSVTLPKNAS